jgi:peptide/nickel transport system permease protein
LPIPWLALLAIRTFAYGHPFALLPPGGLDSLGQAILPVLLLASAPAAVVWRQARQEMRAQYASDWVLAARARGTGPERLWRVYILRAALPRVLALVPPLLAYVFAASVVVERVFAIDGVGDLIARAAAAGDAPVLIASASISASLISLASSGVDALAMKLDPRRETRS